MVTVDPYATTDFLTYEFTSSTVAWALGFPRNQGAYWVARTVDGGKHWQMRYKSQGDGLGTGPFVIRFFDEKRGFVAAGTSGKLLRTTDGGATWKPLSVPESGNSYLRFDDEMHGLMVVPNLSNSVPSRSYADRTAHLYATDDAGDSWKKLPDPPTGMYLMASRGSGEVWLAGATTGTPRVYRSLDGGWSWQLRDIPIDTAGLGAGPWTTSVNLLPGKGVLMTVFCQCDSPSSYFFESFDGGATWRSLPDAPSPNSPVRHVAAYQDDFHWWYVEAKALYRTSDAGQTWTKISDQLPDGLFVPRTIDMKHAWAQIANGSFNSYGLATTSDAGLHWTRVTVPRST